MVFPPQGSGATGGALANLGTSVFSGYPLLNQTDFLAPWGAYDYYIRIITGSPNQYQAYDNKGNKSGSQSTDAAVVINAVLQLLKTTGGKIVRDKGLYNINSLTQDPNETTSYYGYAFPTGNDGSGPIGFTMESAGSAMVGKGTQSPKLGTTIDLVTTAALVGIGSNNAIVYHVLKSTTPNQRVTIIGSTAIFPTQAANRIGFRMVWANEHELIRCNAGFDIAFQSLAAPVGATSYGFQGTYAGTGGENQILDDCVAMGYYNGFAVEDYTNLKGQCVAMRCNIPVLIGETNATYHMVQIDNFLEFSCINSIKFGAQVQGGFQINAVYDIQWDATGAFAKGATIGAIETNPPRTRGRIFYDPVKATVGVTDLPFWVADGSGGLIQTYSSANFGARATGTATTIRQDDYAISVSAAGGPVTVTLPPAATTLKTFVIYKSEGSVNAVTVAAAGADTIQGAATKSLTLQYSKIVLFSDATGTWFDLTIGGV